MLSSFALRVIALITMMIDHVGMVFFPQHIWIRYIGRLSFPIYAFLLATGFIHTSSRKKYLIRLLAAGVISEIPYDFGLYSGFSWQHQNIMFTLSCGLLILWCLDNVIFYPKWYIKLISAAALPILVIMSAWCNFSYGIYGVILPVFYYVFLRWNPLGMVCDFLKDRYPLAAGAGALCTYIFNGITRVNFRVFSRSLKLITLNSTQMYACYSAIPLVLYNGRKGLSGKGLKWFFYLAYPVHIGIIFLLKTFVIK